MQSEPYNLTTLNISVVSGPMQIFVVLNNLIHMCAGNNIVKHIFFQRLQHYLFLNETNGQTHQSISNKYAFKDDQLLLNITCVQFKRSVFSINKKQIFSERQCAETMSSKPCMSEIFVDSDDRGKSISCERAAGNSARRMQGRVRINKAACVSPHSIYLIFRQTRVPPADPHAQGQQARAGIYHRVIYPRSLYR